MNINEIAEVIEDGTAVLKENHELNQEVADILAKHDGPVSIPDIMEMPEEFAENIVRHNGKGLTFNHSNADGPRLSNKAAEILATYKGPLKIMDIDKLNYGETGDEIEIAKAFAKHKHMLELGITKISGSAAKELLKHQGPLNIDGIYENSPEDIVALYEEQKKRWPWPNI